jgi:hypothetical protein
MCGKTGRQEPSSIWVSWTRLINNRLGCEDGMKRSRSHGRVWLSAQTITLATLLRLFVLRPTFHTMTAAVIASETCHGVTLRLRTDYINCTVCDVTKVAVRKTVAGCVAVILYLKAHWYSFPKPTAQNFSGSPRERGPTEDMRPRKSHFKYNAYTFSYKIDFLVKFKETTTSLLVEY